MSTKPKVIKSYDKLDKDVVERLRLAFPRGFDRYLTLVPGGKKKLMSVLPFEDTDKTYLIKMTLQEAHTIILEDESYDESGRLKANVKKRYEKKYLHQDGKDPKKK